MYLSSQSVFPDPQPRGRWCENLPAARVRMSHGKVDWNSGPEPGTIWKGMIMRKQGWILLGVIVSVLMGNAALAGQDSHNKALLDAVSACEDLTEYALALNEARTVKGISSLESRVEGLDSVMSRDGYDYVLANMGAMKKALGNGNFPEVAMLAVDTYKALATELDSGQLKTPVAVVMLDYVGFKIHTLLKQDIVDWHALEDVAAEGDNLWQGMKADVKDRALRDTVDTAIWGISAAVDSRNMDMLYLAAQVELDLVDLLEHFFEGK